MDHQTAFLSAVVITLAVAGSVVASLWRPLYAILLDVCGTEAHARFWRSYTGIMLLLVPLVAVLLSRSQGPSHDPIWVSVLDQARWAVLGLIVALFIVAMGLAVAVQAKPTISVDRDQVDDLERLLNRVEEVRARQILKRAEGSDMRRA